MVGSIQIDNTASGSITYDDTSTCRTRGGLSDITAGTAVTVQDSHGQTIATGALESGSPTITTMSMITRMFTLETTDASAGGDSLSWA